jgi:protein tyrosine/serine phosphatase
MKKFLFCTASTIILILAPQLAAQQTKTQTAPEKIRLAGIHNAGKIDDHLFRGAQPDQDGVQSLQKLGVTTIIDLRAEDHNRSAEEKKQAENIGIKFVLIPNDGWSNPTDAHMAEFFRLIAQRPQQAIFVHCQFGEDRTGVYVAAYRMVFEHWTWQQALAEMRDFHFTSFWHPNMKNYVKHFPQRLATSEALAPYRALTISPSTASTSPR